MPRINIDLPEKMPFETRVPLRIQDINYGGHLGHDALLSILHEVRLQFLASLGCSELDAYGAGLIMTDAALVYKGEGFHGDILAVRLGVADASSRSFDLVYKVSADRPQGEALIAHAKTGMLCFDYQRRKPVLMPDALRQKLDSL